MAQFHSWAVLLGLLTSVGAAYAQTAAFAPVVSYGTGAGSNLGGIALADVNNDGKLDLLSANRGSDTVGVLLGTGTGIFGPTTTFSIGVGSQPISVAVADVNGDGKLDLLTANYWSATVGVLLGTGNGSFGPVMTFPTGGCPLAIVVADVNGDSRPDLLTANSANNNVGVLLNTGAGSFGPLMTFSTGVGYGIVFIAVADVNGDGRPDLLTADYSTSSTSVLLGTGTSIFGAATTFSTGAGSTPYGIAAADVNADGKMDLLTANSGNNTAGVLLGTGTGTFGPV